MVKDERNALEAAIGRTPKRWEHACPGCAARGWTTNSTPCEWCRGQRVMKWEQAEAIHVMLTEQAAERGCY